MDDRGEPVVWLAASDTPAYFLPARSASLPLDDRGLRYGDGLFETMRVHRGGVPLIERHLARLRDGLRTLSFPELALSDLEIVQGCVETARRNGVQSGFLRLAVSRCGGTRGFAAPSSASWRMIAEVGPMDGPLDMPAPLACVFAPWRQDPSYPGSRLKSWSALDKVLAMQHALAVGADECLFLNTSAHLVEGTRANVFAVVADELITPDMASGPLPGIARGLVLELARRSGMTVREAKLPESLVSEASEMFLTSALRGIVPVRAVAGHALPAAPGPVTRTVRQLVEAAIEQAAEDSAWPPETL